MLHSSKVAGWGHMSYGGSLMAENSNTEASNRMAPGVEAMIETQRPAFTAMVEVNTRLYESIAAANREWASFINQRLKEDLAMPRQLAECKNLQDLYRVYAQFFQNACSQYQSGLEQMMKLSQSITETAVQSLQSRSDETTQTKH
jgi:Phasin protein